MYNLTGIKDVDYEILNQLEDVDLIKYCQVNREAKDICNDEIFWYNRIRKKFSYIPREVLDKYVKELYNNIWSKYYIKDLGELDRKYKGRRRKYRLRLVNQILSDGSEKGRLDHVMIALNKGADINYNKFDTPLLWASYMGHIDIVKFLLDEGADPNLVSGPGGATPLLFASMKGHTDIVKLLLDNKANVNVANIRERATPLILASREGHIDVVKLLLENGADINTVDNNGFTAKSIADWYNLQDVYDLLKRYSQ